MSRRRDSIRRRRRRAAQLPAASLRPSLQFERLEVRRLLANGFGDDAAPCFSTALQGESEPPPLVLTMAPSALNEMVGPRELAEGEPVGIGESFVYLGVAPSSPANSGLVALAAPALGAVVPLNQALPAGEGFTGMAFLGDGQLVGATGSGPSDLVRLDPVTGEVLSRVDIRLQGAAVRIGDLAVQPASGTLFAIGAGSQSGRLLTIDPTTGIATAVGDTGTQSGGGLAFTTAGILYLAGEQGGLVALHAIDPATAQVQSTMTLASGIPPLQVFDGLAGADDGTLLAIESGSGRWFSLDPVSGQLAVIDFPPPNHGYAGDIAVQPDSGLRTFDELYHEDFESGPGGFTADNSGGTIPGMWHYSVGRRMDGLINHTPQYNWYYGAFETATGGGHYVTSSDHQGVLTSPEIEIPSGGTTILSFDYLLDTRPELTRDFVEVLIDDGQSLTTIASRQDGTLPVTERTEWRTFTHSLEDFAGQSVRILFSFDTGDPVVIDPEGWYVDDIWIANFPVAGDADVSVDKSASSAAPDEGQEFQYIINAANDADSLATATGVRVVEMLPSGLTLVDFVSSAGVYSPATGVWDQFELPPGAVETLTLTVVSDDSVAGQEVTNLVQIEADQPDPDPDNNLDQETVFINPDGGSGPGTGVPTTTVQFVTPLSTYQTQGPLARPSARLIAIEGRVWHDANGDGDWNAGEPGINGATVELLAGGNLVATAMSVSIDLNNDGSIDPVSEQGLYWFDRTVAPAGDYQLQIQLPTGVLSTFPGDPPSHDVTVVELEQVTADVLQALPPNFGLDTDFASSPAAGRGVIRGHVWHDLNQNGVWDSSEVGRSGWRVFADLNDDGLFDPQTEPFAITGDDGGYVLADLAAGQTYTLLVDNSFLPDGAYAGQTFPAVSPAGRGQVVSLGDGEVVGGGFGVAEDPNFGTYEVTPLVRPADDHLGHVDPNQDGVVNGDDFAGSGGLLTALQLWQSFRIENPSDEPLTITEIVRNIDTSQVSVADQFVTLRQLGPGGALTEPQLPLTVPAQSSIELVAFYDPAVRVGAVVREQYPEWFDDPDTPELENETRPPHTFVADDHLLLLAGTEQVLLVELVGGSTYDSDIFQDGRVDIRDANELFGRLRDGRTVLTDPSGLRDGIIDVNARCENGAEGALASCSWELEGIPLREIELGDFGPINVEMNRSRSPFLDLDADNSSGIAGVGYHAQYLSAPVSVADFDAQFANNRLNLLDQVQVQLVNPTDGADERLLFDNTLALSLGVAGSLDSSGGQLTLTLSGSATIDDYMELLQTVEYDNTASTPTDGERTIEIQAIGEPASFIATGTTPVIEGNVAVSTIQVGSPSPSEAEAEPLPSLHDAVFELLGR